MQSEVHDHGLPPETCVHFPQRGGASHLCRREHRNRVRFTALRNLESRLYLETTQVNGHDVKSASVHHSYTKICKLLKTNVAPRHGFEPRFTAPKAAVLPLDDRGSLGGKLQHQCSIRAAIRSNPLE